MYLGQIKEGTIYLETNSTVNQLIGIDYFYMTDYNYIIKITNGYIQNVDPYQSKDIFSLEMLYRPQTGFKFDLNIVSEKLEIYKDNLNSEKIISFSWLESKKPALIPLSSADWAEAVRQRDDMAIVNRYFIIDVGFSQ